MTFAPATKKGRKPGKSNIPENETAGQRFVRLALARVPRAQKAMDNIRKLAGSNYVSTVEQRAKVIGALRESLTAVEKAYAGQKETQSSFTL